MQTETDREWADGLSPHCKVMDNIEQNLFDELAYYARKHGGSNASIAWGRWRARNALRDGRSPAYAYDVGRKAIDDVLGSAERMSRHPVTDAWVAAKSKGVMDIHCTATGVAGHMRVMVGDTPRWFRVRLEAADHDPQMRLGE